MINECKCLSLISAVTTTSCNVYHAHIGICLSLNAVLHLIRHKHNITTLMYLCNHDLQLYEPIAWSTNYSSSQTNNMRILLYIIMYWGGTTRMLNALHMQFN